MPKKQSNLEEMMKKLEGVVDDLEKEDIGIDKAIKLYDEGIKLAKECSLELGKVEKKINELVNEKDKIRAKDFDQGKK
jgi:exodeoxyribonuclease VII small subunit